MKKDIEEKAKIRLAKFDNMSPEIKEVIRSNNGISIEGQLAIINKIESNLQYYNSQLNWTSTPKNFRQFKCSYRIMLGYVKWCR